MPVGIVSVVFGARCEVLHEDEVVPCLLRGKLKLASSTLVAGDRVEFRRVDPHTAVVERILERRNQLTRSSRERPRRRSSGPPPEQVVLANPDQVVFVAAARDPGIDFALMDRALALARAARLPAAICVNKMDLAPEEEIVRLLQPYRQLGVPLFYTSAADGRGVEALHVHLRERLSFFWGGSGVGKSSLIHSLTGAEVRVGRWRTDNPRGPHTTNVTRLYPLPHGGLIADTPGFDWLELDTVDAAPDRGDILLPEAARYASRCRFSGCAHCGEPDCAVMAAVLGGEIDRARYARFRAAAAEAHPPPRLPIELLSSGEELFFRMRESSSSVWTTFQFHHLFDVESPEREGLLETLGVPKSGEAPLWIVFQQTAHGAVEHRAVLSAKVTALAPLGELLREGEEIILRERGVVRGIGSIRQVRPASGAWRLRKAFRGTAIYDGRAFWSDLKPPAGVRLPAVCGGVVTIGSLHRFEPLPQLALGAVSRQAIGPVLDYLEVGSAEDELDRQ